MRIGSSAHGTRFQFVDGRFTFRSTRRDAPIGWIGLSFSLNGVASTRLRWRPGRAACSATARHSALPATETLDFRCDHAAGRLVVRRTVRAEGDLAIRSVEDGMLDADATILAPGLLTDMRLCHSSHVRTETYPASRAEYPYVRRLAYGPSEYNVGEGHDIPAYYLVRRDYAFGLVEASLREDIFRRVWRIEPDPHMARSRFLAFGAEQRLLGAEQVTLRAGESLVLSETLYQIHRGVHPQDAFDGYLALLSRLHRTRARRSTQLHGACYCTWNYGPLHDVHAAELLQRARIIRERFPAANVFLLDDGYEARPREGNGPLDKFYPDPEANWDRRRFPGGMRRFADRLRALGFLPGIWLNPQVGLDSRLAAERPGWLLQGREGGPFAIGARGYLDPSVPEARAFLLRVLDTLFGAWGFGGLKLDFQSHMFESRAVRFREGTGVQWRNWFYGQVRRRIGPRGFFETCIAMAMGNPFLGRHCDGYRLGADISEGRWEKHRNCVPWSLPAITLPGRDSALPNMDSFGWCDEASDDENLSRMAWCFITQGLLEFGGRLERLKPRQLALFARALAHPDRGHGCRVIDEAAYTGEPFPAVVAVDYPRTSRTWRRGIAHHVALFNWSDEPRMIGATWAQLGFTTRAALADFWSGEAYRSGAEGVFEVLRPHASRLIEVRRR